MTFYVETLGKLCDKEIVTKYKLYLSAIRGPSIRKLISSIRYEKADLEQIIKSGIYDMHACFKLDYMERLRTEFKF
jgi:hypothetical protein